MPRDVLRSVTNSNANAHDGIGLAAMEEMKLDATPLRNAVASLDRALGLATNDAWMAGESQTVRETITAGAIKNFEFVYELSIKLIKRSLARDAEDPKEIDRSHFRDILRMAGEKGLIEDVRAWFEYREMRNRSSHTYDEARARALLAEMPRFLADARALLSQLEVPDA